MKREYCTQTDEEALQVEKDSVTQNKRLKVEVSDGSGFGSNALVFDTAIECHSYAADLFGRWMAAKEYRVAISDKERS
jgi:hypothetical protein